MRHVTKIRPKKNLTWSYLRRGCFEKFFSKKRATAKPVGRSLPNSTCRIVGSSQTYIPNFIKIRPLEVEIYANKAVTLILKSHLGGFLVIKQKLLELQICYLMRRLTSYIVICVRNFRKIYWFF